MQGSNFTSCLDTARREAMFFDTFNGSLHIDSGPKSRIEIPYFLPTVTESGLRIPDTLSAFTFGISMGKILGKRGDISYEHVDQIKLRFGLPSNSKVALIGTGPDPKLESLWKIHKTRNIFERIASMGFEWVTSLTYSVWEREFPRPDQLRNHYRNLRTYDLFTHLGVPCVPFLFPVEEIDFVNTGNWLAQRPAIDTVAVYARYHHRENQFERLLALMSRIERIASRKIRFLVCGIGKADNISRLSKRFDCRFENSKMHEKTIHGQICDSRLRYTPSILSIEDLLRINMARNVEFCESAYRPIIYLKTPVIESGKKNLFAPLEINT